MADSWPTFFYFFFIFLHFYPQLPNEATAQDVEKLLTLHTYGNLTSGKRLFPQVREKAETKSVH